MRGLGKNGHEVSLLSLSDNDPVSLEATRAYCHEVVTVAHDVQDMSGRRWLQLRSLAAHKSFEYYLFRRPEFQARLDEMVASRPYDVVQVEFSQMAAAYRVNSNGAARARLVLDEHNVEYELNRRTAETPGRFDRRLYCSVNWRKLWREELDAWRRFDGVALTSARDERVLRRDLPGTRTVVIPNAVDLESFRPSEAASDPATLVFLGAMNYVPNVDGIHDFVQNTLPKIRARHPEVMLKVVGMNPPASVRELGNDYIEVTGLVDDPRVYLDRATVTIVPLRIGGGTRFKIIESMAKGKAIVSTRLGAEGIEVEHEKHLLLADDPETFADAVCRILQSPELARSLGQSARRLAEERYGWGPTVARLERFYDELLSAS
jgi:glycosyltransferase involved in cell wall biosynthesis